MIEVELRTPAGANGYGAAARLKVYADGSHEAWDPQGLLAWGIDALRPGSETGRGLEHVFFETEPIEWARRLKTIYRTGYVVPVIVRDDEPEYRREH